MNRSALTFVLLVASAASYASSNVQKALHDSRAFEAATELLSRDIGRTPQEGEWPDALFRAPTGTSGWKGPYMRGGLKLDPWGNSYRIKIAPAASKSFGIYSFGRDGIDDSGTADDVSSWAGYEKAIYFPDADRNLAIALAALGAAAIAMLYGLSRLVRWAAIKVRSAQQAVAADRPEKGAG